MVFLAALLACVPSPDPGLDTGDTACEPTTWFEDGDGDGYGAGDGIDSCTAPEHTVANDDDCDDTRASIYPGADEVCNGLDDDCDGVADPEVEVGRIDCYADNDGDGYGDVDQWSEACACPEGTVQDATDCDDSDPSTYPGAPETWYDGTDQDCAGGNDFDADADGYEFGADDCDDQDPSVHPEAEEICGNGVDDDCDGEPGECGLEGEVSSDGATSTVLQAEGSGVWTIGTETADADGDGHPELLVAIHGISGEPRTGIEYALWDLDFSGTQAPSEADVARFVYDESADAWESSAYQKSIGNVDLDGDGYVDFLLGAEVDDDGRDTVRSRIFLEYGPASGTTDLTEAYAAVSTDVEERIGGHRMGVIEADGAGGFTLAAGVYTFPEVATTPVVRFLDQDHFTGKAEVADAPALWMSPEEDLHYDDVTAIRDVDGDGIGDILASVQDHMDSIDTRSIVFLGPFDSDIGSSDADAEIMHDDVGADFSLVSTACTSSEGATWMVVYERDELDPDGLTVHHLIYSWSGPGIYQRDDTQVEIHHPSSGGTGLPTCGGDIDRDGQFELAAEQDTDGYDVGGGESEVVLFEPPESGVWEGSDLPYVNFYIPDRDDPHSHPYDVLQDVDFDGDGVDDFVYTTSVDLPSDGLGDRMVLFRYAGEALGL